MVNPFLPDAWAFRCRQIRIETEIVTIELENVTPASPSPLCGRFSGRVHSQYWRTLVDLPWQGCIVRWHLKTRRFFCGNADCHRRIFAERLPTVTAAYGRHTIRLDLALAEIAFTGGGDAGARLAAHLAMPTSPDTSLRRIRRSPIPSATTPEHVGVDGWAVRRGKRYGTIVCDLDRHCPIDLLDDREAQTVADWLRLHPEIQVITRDRARFYVDGATAGAPQATQVADRFHLMRNLRRAQVKMMERRHRHLVAATAAVPKTQPRADPPPIAVEPATLRLLRLPRRDTMHDVRRARRLERYQKVMDLHEQNMSDRTIAKQLGINRETVARCGLASFQSVLGDRT